MKDFPWSSHRYFLILKTKHRPDWLDSDFVLSQFAGKRAKAVSLYKDFMRRDLDKEVSGFYSKKYWGPVLGDDSFVDKIKEKYVGGDTTLDKEVKGKRSIRGIARVRKINKEVCGLFKIPDEPLGVDTVQVAHEAGEVALRRLDQRVIVIGHQAIGSHPDMEQ